MKGQSMELRRMVTFRRERPSNGRGHGYLHVMSYFAGGIKIEKALCGRNTMDDLKQSTTFRGWLDVLCEGCGALLED